MGKGIGHRTRRGKLLRRHMAAHGCTANQAREHLRPQLQQQTPNTPTDPALAAVLATTLDELDLKIRAGAMALDRAGLKTVALIIEETARDLLDLRNFGQKSLDELKSKLAGLTPPVYLKGETPRRSA